MFQGRCIIHPLLQYLLLCLCLSILNFAFYAWDKRQAMRQQRQRTPEKLLLILGLIGGWPGGYLAQKLCRHKTSKVSFQVLFWLTVVVNVAAVGYWYWQG